MIVSLQVVCQFIGGGAPNVTDHIPANTFIDRRNFKSYKELYSYLKNIPDKKYMGYLDAIRDFIESDKIYPFSAKCFADIITNEVVKGLKKSRLMKRAIKIGKKLDRVKSNIIMNYL